MLSTCFLKKKIILKKNKQLPELNLFSAIIKIGPKCPHSLGPDWAHRISSIVLSQISLSLPFSLKRSITNHQMPTPTPLSSASTMLRQRLIGSLRTRGGSGSGASRWTSQGHEEHPKGLPFNRTPPPPGQSRKWEDWELPCYITSFLTIVILGVGLNAKPDLTIETWAHEKALERLKMEDNLAASNNDESLWIRIEPG